MAKKILEYVEFRYTDGRRQILNGKDAQNWMDFTKRTLELAKTVDKDPPKRNWEWERFDVPKPIPKQKPKPKTKPVVKPKPKPKTKVKPKPKPTYSEYDN